MSYAIHNQNQAFNDSAVAQYMNTDFIVLDIALCVALAREQFFKKLKDDDYATKYARAKYSFSKDGEYVYTIPDLLPQ